MVARHEICDVCNKSFCSLNCLWGKNLLRPVIRIGANFFLAVVICGLYFCTFLFVSELFARCEMTIC